MQRGIAAGLSILVAFSGCASYTPSSVPTPKAGAMPAWRTEGVVSVGADPYVEPERQKAVFDESLGDAGVLPIQVLLQNQGDRRVLVRRSDITLALPNGGEFSSTGATAAAAKVESIGGVVGATIAFGLIGFLVASSASDRARAARLADYRSKELQDATLGKDGSAHGFVFFIPPDGTQAFNDATLVVRFVDMEDASSSVVRLPMASLGFKGAPAKPQPAATPTGDMIR